MNEVLWYKVKAPEEGLRLQFFCTLGEGLLYKNILANEAVEYQYQAYKQSKACEIEFLEL